MSRRQRTFRSAVRLLKHAWARLELAELLAYERALAGHPEVGRVSRQVEAARVKVAILENMR